jgi:hypothetical protein
LEVGAEDDDDDAAPELDAMMLLETLWGSRMIEFNLIDHHITHNL